MVEPVIRNPFSTATNEKFKTIIEKALPVIRKTSDAKVVAKWQENLTKERLMSLIDYDIPKNKESNLSRVGFSQPREECTEVMQELFPSLVVDCSGYFLYPTTGFMGWHTNRDTPTDRIYVTYASEDKRSFFRYYHNGEVHTDYDDKGITVRRFNAPGSPPYFWHCVGSACDRVSIGFILNRIVNKENRPMAKYALVKDSKVHSLVEWNGDTNIWSPPSDTTAVVADDTVGIGHEYVDGAFKLPEVVPIGIDQLWLDLRNERNQRLKDTDWVSTRAFDSGTALSDAWKTYRQTLRDIPSTLSDPEDVVWPDKPA